MSLRMSYATCWDSHSAVYVCAYWNMPRNAAATVIRIAAIASVFALPCTSLPVCGSPVSIARATSHGPSSWNVESPATAPHTKRMRFLYGSA